jgi:hypothetical protein
MRNAVMGDPVTPRTWLVNVLGERGVCLRAGDVVLPGASMAAAAAGRRGGGYHHPRTARQRFNLAPAITHPDELAALCVGLRGS